MLPVPPQKLLLCLSLILVVLGTVVVLLPNDSWWHDALQLVLAVGFLSFAVAQKKGLLTPKT